MKTGPNAIEIHGDKGSAIINYSGTCEFRPAGAARSAWRISSEVPLRAGDQPLHRLRAWRGGAGDRRRGRCGGSARARGGVRIDPLRPCSARCRLRDARRVGADSPSGSRKRLPRPSDKPSEAGSGASFRALVPGVRGVVYGAPLWRPGTVTAPVAPAPRCWRVRPLTRALLPGRAAAQCFLRALRQRAWAPRPVGGGRMRGERRMHRVIGAKPWPRRPFACRRARRRAAANGWEERCSTLSLARRI